MAAATSTSSDPSTADGPVLNVINKRLRALRKKHNRILQMEDSLSQGKTLNNEQQEVLRSKPSVLALIDELEKLRSPISSAVEEEISLALASEEKAVREDNDDDDSDNNNQNHHRQEEDGGGVVVKVKDLLNLMYFGSLFDVKPQSDFTSLMITRSHERSCCLTYDYVTDDATDLLGDRDLDLISALQGLMVSRPVNSAVSHQNALEKCVEHAKLWLESSELPIDPQSDVTYAGLKEKLNKIMASDYFTATPQMKGPGEVAAAAAVGNFGSFQVPMHESMVPVDVPIEGSVEHYPETEENAANYEEYETGEHQSGNVNEFQKDVEAETPAEMVSAHTEQEQAHAEEEQYRNADYKEQHYMPRRGQRGGRGGGGRRGYPNGRGGRGNGRGGGPYQNGRNQYNENYYPRNNYYNRRGGRGTGGTVSGGNPRYQSSAGQGNNSQANMGVAS